MTETVSDSARRDRLGLLLTVIGAAGFGIWPAAAQKVYLDGGNAVYVIIATTFFRAAALIVISLVGGKSLVPPPELRRAIVSGGFFQSLSIFGLIASVAYLPGPVTIIILFTHTIMLLFYMAFRGEIALTRVAVGSTVAALVGISFVLNVWSNVSRLSTIGILLAFLAAIATASRLYVFGKQVQEQDPAVVGAQVLTVSLGFTLLALFFISPAAPITGNGYFWLGVCSVSLIVGTTLMFYAIALIGPFRYSLMVKLEPVISAIFSILVLGEYLTVSQYVGMALVLISLVTYQLLEGRR